MNDEPRDRKELLEENERLKRELLHRRSNPSMWPVILGLFAHILLRPFLDPWLNAPSDRKVAVAVVILAVPVVFALTMLVKALTHRRR